MTTTFMPLSSAKESVSQLSSLPSPPTSSYRTTILKPSTFNIEQTAIPPIQSMKTRYDLISDTRFNSYRRTGNTIPELRPILYNKKITRFDEYLPSIQNVMTPFTSPSSPLECYFNSSFSSSIASSPPAEVFDENHLLFHVSSPSAPHLVKCHEDINIRRKGSIASILNSGPELQQLDEEENKCNYLSHFDSSLDRYQDSFSTLKRGRPRQDMNEPVKSSIKKQKCDNLPSCLHSTIADNKLHHSKETCQSKSKLERTRATVNSPVSQLDSPRATKGLRHFSKQVCDKVAEKGITTYNEVADELALDIQMSSDRKNYTYDQKNIRRRVYDALNVLMAMNIIVKDKKVIKWLGIPNCYQQLNTPEGEDTSDTMAIEDEKKKELLNQIEQEERRHKILIESVASSKKAVDDSLFKHLQIRNLIMRNQQNDLTEEQKIPLPFFLITCPTNKSDLMIDVDHDGLSAVVSFTHNTVVCNGVVYKSTDILQHMKLDDKVG